MLDRIKCIRCNCDIGIFDWNDAEYYTEELLAEGISPNEGDMLDDDCAQELQAQKEVVA